MSDKRRQRELTDHVVDLMQSIGPVQARRMFGGYGIFLGELMFALVLDNTLYLKADQETEAAFTARGLQPFTYQRQGRPIRLHYFEAPEEVFDESEAMQHWANRAYGVALRSANAGPQK